MDNKKIADLSEQLKNINPQLNISSKQYSGDKLISAGVCFKQKGNAELIKSLKDKGWYVSRKDKRGNVFYVHMDFDFKYRKYAIYKTPYGLRAMDYVDNVFEARKYLGIQVEDLPVIVNDAGGHTSFDEEYERIHNNFVEIIEVDAKQPPLTREQQFPKNSDLFHYGWIDPMGNTYTCGFEGHHRAAKEICKELGLNQYNSEMYLEEHNWIKISRRVPYSSDNIGSQTSYFTGERITKHQIDRLIELKLYETDRHTRCLVEMAMREG